MSTPPGTFRVEIPGSGAPLQLQSVEEVEQWDRSKQKYVADYHLTKLNDLVLLGAILQQQIVMYRAQLRMNGMEAVLDANQVPTGQYRQTPVDSDVMAASLSLLTKATDQIRLLEKALGIDKVTREAGGQHTVGSYIQTLKKAAHLRGLHISKRALAYEKFVNELRWRIRILRNADAEDRAYHDLTPEKVLDWCHDQLKELEDADVKFANERGKVFVGKL